MAVAEAEDCSSTALLPHGHACCLPLVLLQGDHCPRPGRASNTSWPAALAPSLHLPLNRPYNFIEHTIFFMWTRLIGIRERGAEGS